MAVMRAYQYDSGSKAVSISFDDLAYRNDLICRLFVVAEDHNAPEDFLKKADFDIIEAVKLPRPSCDRCGHQTTYWKKSEIMDPGSQTFLCKCGNRMYR